MKKIIKIIESNKLFILGIALGVGISCISVYSAANIITSKRVGYTNTQSHLTADNVQDAIDELYTHARNYQILKNDMLNTVYPVGSIYISTSLSTTSQVAAKLGGTWEVFGDGRVLRGTTGTAGSTGGSDTHTLTTAELPAHTHTVPAHSHGLNNHTHTIPSLSGSCASAGAHTHTVSGTCASAGAHTHGVNYNAKVAAGSERAHLAGSDKTATANDILVSAGAHTHSLSNGSAASAGAHTHTFSTTATNTGGNTGNTANSAVLTSGSTGSGTAFSVLDPYITVYMYKRTS